MCFDTFKLELGVCMYKHQTNSLPKTFSDYLIKHNQVHNYPTRNAQNYSIHKSKKSFLRSGNTNNLLYGILWMRG